jgi:ABC-type Na+ efflux pump permease subunit
MFFIGISIAAPLLLAFLFSIAFGGEESNPSFSIEMAFVNQDVPPQESPNLGAVVQDIFASEELRDLIHLTEMPDEASALQGILDQRFSAALIIPADFSSAVTEEDSSAQLRIISDPATSIVTQILDYIVTTIADSFSASKISMSLAVEELQRQGGQADEIFYADLTDRLNSQSASESPYLTIVDPQGSAEEGQDSQQQHIIATIMVGMMIFFSFYTGAFASESILSEEENGTLARNLSLPHPFHHHSGRKVSGVFITLLVQVWCCWSVQRSFSRSIGAIGLR